MYIHVLLLDLAFKNGDAILSVTRNNIFVGNTRT